MIVYLPAALFLLGLLVAYGSAGLRRQAATLVMVLGAAWALALLLDPGAAAWGAGVVLATVLLPRPAQRVPSTFEVLSRRALTIAGLMVLALVVASQLPVGENPLLLNAVPWFLGAAGTAWALNPIDPRERAQGHVLMVGASGAVILLAAPAGVVTAAAAGLLALVPVIVARRWVRPQWRRLLSLLMLALAALAAILALTGMPIARQSAGDLVFGFAGPVLLGVAVVLAAAALVAPFESEWTGILAALALLATAPALRWSAIAALIAASTAVERDGERPAWMAFAAFGAVPLLQGLAPPQWSSRFQAVALGTALVLMLYAARRGLFRAVVLPATGFLVLLAVGSLSAGNLTRFQWIAAIGVLVLIGRTILLRTAPRSPATASFRDPLLAGLLLLASSARDALGLGALAAVLLLIDLALVRQDVAIQAASSLRNRLVVLARSNWPPAITFAGGSLAVIAALQASLALGLLAALLLAALQLSPLLDRDVAQREVERPRSAWHWVGPAIAIACGTAPAVLLRMLRL
ncbi:MAG: hypothetical protein E6I56_03560 [Chloroflexi bacterium]|nr:MAG: hypothetical protein E6I56_03560 [Chloroflexota bacterium]